MVESRSAIVEAMLLLGWAAMWPLIKIKDGLLYVFVADSRNQVREDRQDRVLTAARQKIGAQVGDLEERLELLRDDEKKYLQQALTAKRKGEKKLAISSMKLLQTVRKDIAVVDNALQSAERDLSEIHHTSVVRDVVASKREVRKAVGSTGLKQLASETESLVDDTLDAAEQLESIEMTLTEVVAAVRTGDDDESLMAELDALEEAELDARLREIPEVPRKQTSAFDKTIAVLAPQPEPEPEPEKALPSEQPRDAESPPDAVPEHQPLLAA